MTRKDTNNQPASSPTSSLSANSFLERLRTAFESATANCALRSISDAEERFGTAAVGQLSNRLCDKLNVMLRSDEASGFDTHDLRTAAGAFALERAVGVSDQKYDDIIEAILPCLEAGTELNAPSDDCWVGAAEIGIALSILDDFRRPNQRHEAVASAASRLVHRGYKLTLVDGRVDRTGPAILEIFKSIRDRLERIGLTDSLSSLLGTARSCCIHAFDQYLFGRSYEPISSEPAIPFGFLLNVLVQVSDRPSTSMTPETDWREAVELARDLTTVIDVQPYNKFWMINTKPRRVEGLLNEIGLYDHLFGFRQWASPITPLLLRSFFGTEHETALTARYGWSVADAELLSAALVKTIRKEPQQLTRADFMSTSLDGDTLDRMLPHFAHEKGMLNACYDSPMAASKADFMFRPLIEGRNGVYFAPTASTIGPACYEVVATAMRETLPSSEISDLVGAGTERSVAALFGFFGIQPTIEGLKYNEGGKIDVGECDLVLEDNDNILLIECKAKPLTRATMGGKSFAAILDYGASIIASQVQALQHERILRDNGEINFDNGQRLRYEGRKITRLSVTLLDHGSMQDHFLLMNLVEPLLRSPILIDSGKRRSRCGSLLMQLDKHQAEMMAVKGRNKNPWQKALGAASLSFGQLAVILIENPTVSALVDVLRKPVTYATMNTLLEY